MNQFPLMMNQLELPPDFPHEPPKGYHYEVEPFRRNVCRICIVNDGTFTYTTDAPKCVWGFYDSKKGRYSAPINFSKQGDPVDICLLYTSPSPRDRQKSRMPSSA